LGNNVPVVVNFHTYNTVCRSFSQTPLFNAIWAHEYLGTNNPFDPILANGHEARRRNAARDPNNDPYRLAERRVGASYVGLRLGVVLDVDAAESRITAGADPDHGFVLNNYLVQGTCGTAWVFDTTQLSYVLITVQVQRPNGFVCL
jgi:hypothetical protein